MGLPPTEPREYCRPAVRLRMVGGSGGNGSLAGTESILASCHESSRSKTFTRTQSRCMAPLTLNLSALPPRRHGDRRGVGSGAGRVRNGEPVERATGPNGPKGQRRARSLWFVVVIQLFGLWRHGGAPRGRVGRIELRPRGAPTARAAVDGRCRGWSADHAPRSAAVFAPLSRALFTAPHTAPL